MTLLHPDAPKAPLLVLAVGNPSRGDDAIGPLLAEQLTRWLAQQDDSTRARIDVITDQQLVVEHVFDLQGRQRVLFIDAAAQGPAAVQLMALQPPTELPAVSSHSSTPTQLLGLHRSLLNTPPPPAALLTLTGHGFELGAPLSDEAQRGMPLAWDQLQAWLHHA